MFRDMSSSGEDNEKQTPYSRFTTWTLRLLLLVIILFFANMGVMSLLNGTGPSQKAGLKAALDNVTGMNVDIGLLEQFEALPRLAIAAGNLKADSKSDLTLHLEAERFEFAANPFDQLIGNNSLQHIFLKNVELTGIGNADKTLFFESVVLEKASGEKPPQLKGVGQYAGKKLEFSVVLTADGASYKIDKGSLLALNFNGVKLEGQITKSAEPGLHLNEAAMTNGKITAAGNAIILLADDGVHIKGDIAGHKDFAPLYATISPLLEDK